MIDYAPVRSYSSRQVERTGKLFRPFTMKHFISPLVRLLFLLGATAAILAPTPPSLAAAKKLNWYDSFDGVVHDAKNIKGFVGEDRWLSNFFPCRVEWDGRVYGSAEVAFHSAKYPAAERDAFTKLDAEQARKLSRTKPYDKAAWETRKLRVMHEIVWAKFSQNPELGKKLLATGDRYLEETNWWGDKVWGVYKGEGENLTGKVLMDTRARLAKERAAESAKAK